MRTFQFQFLLPSVLTTKNQKIMLTFQAVKNKEIDMKGAAELLGVSYGTLYGRYRETFGYLKHAWNVSGRPHKKTNLW